LSITFYIKSSDERAGDAGDVAASLSKFFFGKSGQNLSEFGQNLGKF